MKADGYISNMILVPKSGFEHAHFREYPAADEGVWIIREPPSNLSSLAVTATAGSVAA
jgi:hypothetical protein